MGFGVLQKSEQAWFLLERKFFSSTLFLEDSQAQAFEDVCPLPGVLGTVSDQGKGFCDGHSLRLVVLGISQL